MKESLVLTLLFSGLLISCDDKKSDQDVIKPQPPVVVAPKPPEAPQLKGTWKAIDIDFGPCHAKPVDPCEIGKEASGKNAAGGCSKWKCQ